MHLLKVTFHDNIFRYIFLNIHAPRDLGVKWIMQETQFGSLNQRQGINHERWTVVPLFARSHLAI